MDAGSQRQEYRFCRSEPTPHLLPVGPYAIIRIADDAVDDDVDAAWRAEIRRRLQQIDSGEVETVDWLEARERILG